MLELVEFILGGLLSQWLWPSVLVTSIFGGSVLYYLSHLWRQQKGTVRKPRHVDMNHQSVSIPNDQGYDVRGSPLASEEFTTHWKIQTAYDNFKRGIEVSGNGDCLGYRTSDTSGYAWISYGQVMEKAHRFGSGLLKLGLKPGNETCIGIYARNSPEWVITELGACSQSIIIVPLYDTLGVEVVTYIVNQAQIELVVCDTSEKAMKVIKNVSKTPTLKHLIIFENPTDSKLAEKAKDEGLNLKNFQEIQEMGTKEKLSLHLPKSEDIYIICYTSGTTGQPKGVIISHRNLISNAASGITVFDRFNLALKPGQVAISYLPLAHMFEQITKSICFYYGCKVGYFRGKVTGLLDDMKVLKPDLFPVVPRLLNRLYDKIQSNLEKTNPIARGLFHLAYNAKLKEMKRGIIRKNSLWDKLIFRRLQNELGGNVSFLVTGSAPVAEEVLEMSRVSLGALVLEGYGQTECTAVATLTIPGDTVGGHVGGPAPNVEIRLADAPELDYYARDGKGEVCVRGENVTRGYFNDPEKTAEVLDEDGWLHTGDVGVWLPNGTLRIVDRKKHIFKLAQGEYVAPEKIENIYIRTPVVAQMFVDGNSFQRFLVAIVVPHESVLRDWYIQEVMGSEEKREPSLQEICSNPKAVDYVLSEMKEIGKENKLNSIEQVKAIYLCPEPFTLENGLLTPTMKAKRPQLRKVYAKIIEDLYKIR